jgi:hypothetical protein
MPFLYAFWWGLFTENWLNIVKGYVEDGRVEPGLEGMRVCVEIFVLFMSYLYLLLMLQKMILFYILAVTPNRFLAMRKVILFR